MSRVLVTGGVGAVGAAIVRRLLRDPAYEVRVSDSRPAPVWMREGSEVHTGDLRSPDAARRAMQGCAQVIHLATIAAAGPHTLVESNAALDDAVVRAALEHAVERFVYGSCASVFERATVYPTAEEHLWECPPPRSPPGFSKLTGEVHVRAAHEEHGLPFTICRLFDAYGPEAVPGLVRTCVTLPSGTPLPVSGDGTQTRTLTHVDDVAEGIVVALASPAALGEDFNISAAEERSVADISRLIWEACGRDPDAFALEHEASFPVDVQRRWPSVEKARRLLGWEARIDLREGIAQTVEWLRARIAQPAR
jgi:UDP-glucose 4-epimerase